MSRFFFGMGMAAAAGACLAAAVAGAGPALAARSAAAAPTAHAESRPEDLSRTEKAKVRVWDESGRRRVQASIWVPFDSSAVWPVVLDYNGLSRFMPNVVSSQIVERKENSVIVHQVGRGRFIFRKTVRFDLEFRRADPSAVSFRQVSGDFDEFSGTWSVRPEKRDSAPGSRILYAATVRAGLPLPGFLARKLLRKAAADMMPALAAEIARREASARSGGE